MRFDAKVKELILMDITIGFTGTQLGMTALQKAAVSGLISELHPVEARHGDCIGADADFHNIVRLTSEHENRAIRITSHPPINKSKRAFCKVDVEEIPLDYLDRNRQIVAKSDVMIATPKGFEEELRSGTWATVRYARKAGKRLYIVYPNGEVR